MLRVPGLPLPADGSHGCARVEREAGGGLADFRRRTCVAAEQGGADPGGARIDRHLLRQSTGKDGGGVARAAGAVAGGAGGGARGGEPLAEPRVLAWVPGRAGWSASARDVDVSGLGGGRGGGGAEAERDGATAEGKAEDVLLPVLPRARGGGGDAAELCAGDREAFPGGTGDWGAREPGDDV